MLAVPDDGGRERGDRDGEVGGAERRHRGVDADAGEHAREEREHDLARL